MLQNRFTLPQVRLDIAHEFLGFRLETARHVSHMTRRDLCRRFRALRYGGQKFVTIRRDERETTIYTLRRLKKLINKKISEKRKKLKIN